MSTSPANRLARESSPYLLLHAHNPVDWYPWGPEAIERARREDKPIFLSVGYSTCYWCHVMERESFSDPAIAAELNRDFVAVKVDREERPDLDEVYMLATQILAGQGGWPSSLFLTPELRPFFAGTYFPPRDAQGRPGFSTVLHSMRHAWTERRDEVDEQAAQVAEAIRHHLEEIEPWSEPLPGRELVAAALDGLRKRFDGTFGGFGQQPKFPTPSNLWLLAREADADRAAAMMLVATLDGMARGGIFDQLAGGFHRYSTDREWRVPHFEKMLYDNGLLLEAYAREHARSGSDEARRVALATADWLATEMTTPEGAFWSAIDAETQGQEGAYYVWTRPEIDALLGEEDATFLAPLYGFDGDPDFEERAHVLHLPRPLEVQARERRTTRASLLAEIEPLAGKLLEARSRRERPRTDDKVLADWNGTAIAGLAVAGDVLGRGDLVERAARAADFLLVNLRRDGGVLQHSWRAGEARVDAFLADYVYLVRGLLRLHEATGAARWLESAAGLQAEQTRRLESPRGGFFNASASDDLLFRTKEVFDGAMPAANGVAALNLLDLHAATGDAGYRAQAERTLRAFAPVVATHPDGARTLVVALARFTPGGDGAPHGSSGATAANPAAAVTAGGEPASDGRDALSDLRLELGGATDDGFRPFALHLAVREGWHLSVEADLPRLEGVGATLERVEWPSARSLAERDADASAPGYRGAIEVSGRLRRDAPRASLRLRYVACGEDRCLPAAEREIPIG